MATADITCSGGIFFGEAQAISDNTHEWMIVEPETYGDGYAELFDYVYGEHAHESLVSTLAELAGEGPVLELGVGTGRVSIPLASRGLEVHGIDNSAAMLKALAAKPGGEAVRTTVSELPEIEVEGTFSLVACVDNTMLLLPTQELQLACVKNAADRMSDDGVLVFETFATPPDGDAGVLPLLGENATVLWAYHADKLSQQFHIREVIIGEDLVRVVPFDGRMVAPAELDLMAQLAGLQLRVRWGGWDKEPPAADSMVVVSVYEKASNEIC